MVNVKCSSLVKSAGGIVSVALSLKLPSVAINNCLALCCPDFPPDKLIYQAISQQTGLAILYHKNFSILYSSLWPALF